MSKKKLYVAYGSNINLGQMAMRCPNSTVAGTSMLKGYELQFKYHATIEQNADSEVPVLVWDLDPDDERVLDRYEGEPKYYRKENVELELNGETVEAMVYIMNGDKSLQTPSEQYYRTIEQGYKANGLDLEYLEAALTNAIELEEEAEEEIEESEYEDIELEDYEELDDLDGFDDIGMEW